MPRNSLSQIALLLPVGLWLHAGCETLEAMEEDGKPRTIEKFCGEYARVECEPTALACSRNKSECEPIRRAACQTLVSPLQDAARVFRTENAEACLARLRATYQKNLITALDLSALDDECSRVVEGAGVANSTCLVDQDCRSPFVCDKGRCGPLRVVASGGNCANPGEVCQPNEYCRRDETFAVCSARFDKGAACSDDLPCKPNLRCNGTCVDKLAANAPCTRDGDCLTGYCNLYPPAGTSRTCLPGLSFAPFAPTCEAYFGPPPTTATPITRGVPVP